MSEAIAGAARYPISRQGVRACRPEDIARVAELYARVMRSEPQAAPELTRYFHDIFFENPWYDETFPSLVYENEQGRISGFIGRHMRRMVYKGRTIKTAYAGQLVTDPSERKSLAGVYLLREFLKGGQELSITDGATALVHRLWRQFGGNALMLSCMQWTRILRPIRFALNKFERHPLAGIMMPVANPVLRLADTIGMNISTRYFRPQQKELPDSPLDPGTVVDYLPRFYGKNILRPDYSQAEITWILGQLGRIKSRGKLVGNVVRDGRGKTLGWYIYFFAENSIVQVVQIAAKPGHADEVLNHVFTRAWEQGGLAVQGRLEFDLVEALSDKSCLFSYYGPTMLIHSQSSEITSAIANGSAFLTRLEGEWWPTFHREKFV